MTKKIWTLVVTVLVISVFSGAYYFVLAGVDASPIVTRAKFDRLKVGMQYAEVIAIFGGDGEAGERHIHWWRGHDGIADIEFESSSDGHLRIVSLKWLESR